MEGPLIPPHSLSIETPKISEKRIADNAFEQSAFHRDLHFVKW